MGFADSALESALSLSLSFSTGSPSGFSGPLCHNQAYYIDLWYEDIYLIPTQSLREEVLVPNRSEVKPKCFLRPAETIICCIFPLLKYMYLCENIVIRVRHILGERWSSLMTFISNLGPIIAITATAHTFCVPNLGTWSLQGPLWLSGYPFIFQGLSISGWWNCYIFGPPEARMPYFKHANHCLSFPWTTTFEYQDLLQLSWNIFSVAGCFWIIVEIIVKSLEFILLTTRSE